MSERDALIAAIREAPDDDTARLVYADYLDERPDRGDLDRATAEFIRMSCVKPGAKVMPRKVYPWLLSKGDDGVTVENWKRFLPGLLAIDAANSFPGEAAIGRRDGRMVRCAITVPVADQYEAGYSSRPYVTWSEFHRGFVTSFTVTSSRAALLFFEPVVKDQPLVKLHLLGLSAVLHPLQMRQISDLVERLQGADEAERFAKRHF